MAFVKIDEVVGRVAATLLYTVDGWALETAPGLAPHYITGDLTHVLISAEVEGLL